MREIRASSTSLIDALSESGEVILTNHGKPFARVVPLDVVADVQPPLSGSLKWLHDRMPKVKVGSEVIVRQDRDGRD